MSNSSTLCGEDQVNKKVQQLDNRSHQDSWFTKSNVVQNSKNILFHRNVGFVANDTSCSNLPCAQPVDTNDPDTYLRVVDAVNRSGVPNYKQVHIPLCSSFDWQYLQRNTIDYHDKALVDYIQFGFPLSLFPDYDIRSNANENHSSAREFELAVDEYIQSELKAGALLGPFDNPPHDKFTWSPLMT